MKRVASGSNVTTLVFTRHQVKYLTEKTVSMRGRESCGLLSGRVVAGYALVEGVHFATNVCESADEFAIAPIEYLAIVKSLREDLFVVGVFHSHCGDARPSKADVESITLMPVVWLILGNTAAGIAERVSLNAIAPCDSGARQVLVCDEDELAVGLTTA